MRLRPRTQSAGFTLVELLAVLVILGILAAFILTAAMDGLRRSEERATQALIIKLDTGVSDRLEAVLTLTVDIHQAHRYLSNVYFGPGAVPSEERAGVIAQMDLVKSEMPDVFMLQVSPAQLSGGSLQGVYPFNFAAVPYALSAASITQQAYMLPLGIAMPPPLGEGLPGLSTGIYGASYFAAAGLYKNLGYAAIGYDGRDNNNDGFVDDLLEGTNLGDTTILATIVQNLENHDHRTARSEMLYALLVEGNGPIGSFMRRDDFTNREVQDTDHDGLPEFVDAWGQPIQFFRWPVHYTSPNDYQKGFKIYSMLETRQQDPLDANQLLLSPSWWMAAYNSKFPVDPNQQPPNSNSAQISELAYWVQSYFHPLTDFNWPSLSSSLPSGSLWDRGSSFSQRRAYYSRFLILSPGLDHNVGIGMCGVDYAQQDVVLGNSTLTGQVMVPLSPLNLVGIEGAAAPFSPFRVDTVFWTKDTSATSLAVDTYLQDAASDDITNHNVLAGGGGIH